LAFAQEVSFDLQLDFLIRMASKTTILTLFWVVFHTNEQRTIAPRLPNTHFIVRGATVAFSEASP